MLILMNYNHIISKHPFFWEIKPLKVVKTALVYHVCFRTKIVPKITISPTLWFIQSHFRNLHGDCEVGALKVWVIPKIYPNKARGQPWIEYMSISTFTHINQNVFRNQLNMGFYSKQKQLSDRSHHKLPFVCQ